MQTTEGSNIYEFGNIQKNLSKLKNENVTNVNFFWKGEPCLSPFLPDIVKYAKKRGYHTYVSTNMAVANLHDIKYVSNLLSSLDKLEVCIDGYNQETLQKYRVGTKWEIVMKNLETIGGVSTQCQMDMKVLMFRYNEHHEDFFEELARKHNMTSLTFVLPCILGKMILTEEEADEWLAQNPKYQRYQKKGDVWVHKTMETCLLQPVVSVSGDVYPCCYDRMMQYPLGNIFENDLKTIKRTFNNLKPKMLGRQLEICKEYCFLPNCQIHFREDLH